MNGWKDGWTNGEMRLQKDLKNDVDIRNLFVGYKVCSHNLYDS